MALFRLNKLFHLPVPPCTRFLQPLKSTSSLSADCRESISSHLLASCTSIHIPRLTCIQTSSTALSVLSHSPMSTYYSSPSVALHQPLSPSRLGGMNTMRQAASCSDFREPIRMGQRPIASPPMSSNPPNVRSNFRLGDWMYVTFLKHLYTI